MTTEEKARAYDEALKKVKSLHTDWKNTGNKAAKEIETVFPELAESEDERMLSSIIDDCKKHMALMPKQIEWLEKHKKTIVRKQQILTSIRKHTSDCWDFRDNPRLNNEVSKIFASYWRLPNENLHQITISDLVRCANHFYEFGRQARTEWSKEDKQTLQGVISEITANKNEAPESDHKTYDRYLAFLKSIQPAPAKTEEKPSAPGFYEKYDADELYDRY